LSGLSFLNPLNWSKKAAAPAGGRPFEEVISALEGGSWGRTMSGEPVNLTTGLRVSTVLACAKVIADGCATPDLNIFRNLKGNKREIADDIPEYRLLNRRPNEWQTSREWRHTMTMHAVLTGDALSIKVKVANKIKELIPVQPGMFHIENFSRYDVKFRCYDQFGLIGVFSPDDVFHLPNMRWDLIKSLDVLSLARESIGLAIAAERNQATLHENGGRPAGVLSSKSPISAEAITRLREAWKIFSTTNRNGTAVLDSGFEYAQLAMSGVDGQSLETRRFQVEEICRPFGVFPIMVGHSDKTATFASSEAFFSAHLKHTLKPWHKAWQERIDEFILDGSGPLYAEFNTRYLTEGSMVDQAMWVRAMIDGQVFKQNEMRDWFGLDAVPDGDRFIVTNNAAGGNTNAP
jgi:HK97 family phage portal protein